MLKSRMHQMGMALDYAAGSDIAAGDLIKVAGLVGSAINAIASGAVGALQIKGVAAIRKKDEAMVAGLPIWWDADGDPKVGDSGDGAATSLGAGAMAAGDLLLGSAVADAAAADEWVYVALNEFNADFPAWANRLHTVGVTATLGTAQSGNVIRVAADAQTLTFSEIAATHIGREFIIVNDGADGANLITLTPHTNDGFAGHGITHAVNKSLSLTKTTSKRGDYIRVLTAGDTFIQVLEKRGIWAREA